MTGTIGEDGFCTRCGEIAGWCRCPVPEDAADPVAAAPGPPGGDDPAAQAAPPGPAAAPGPHVIVLADVEPEHVDWLWPGYLPRGKLVILDGDPDQGKSTISLDLGARISTGSLMPDGAAPVKGAVLILSAEDGLADTIRPRLDAAGGDPEQVLTITEITVPGEAARPVSLPADLPHVEQVVRDHGVVLVVVDVLMAYLSGTVNAHRDQDIRLALHPLAAMADRAGCCVLVIRHLNKTGGTHAIYRGGGSIGIVGAARAAFMVGTDPEDDTGSTRVLAPVKCNLARRPPALAYRLVMDELNGCVRVDWLGATDRRAADLLASPEDEAAREERSEHGEAADWLTDYLTGNGGEASWADIKKEARAAGIAERTLQRAHRRAGVTISRSGFPARTLWSIDPNAQSRQPDGATGASGATGATGDLSSQSRQPRQQTPTENPGASGATGGADAGEWPPGSIGEQASQQPPTEGDTS